MASSPFAAIESPTLARRRPAGAPRKGEQTRAAIVDAALELAARDGLEGLTIGALAERMRMSKSGVFAHFGSREDLHAYFGERDRSFRSIVTAHHGAT